MHALAMMAAVGALARVSAAQTTRITFEASADPPSGTSWTSDLTVSPGATVYVRMRVRLEGGTALGLGG